MAPRTNFKLNAVARAALGEPRECDSCGESKEISIKTYAPNNRGVRGWSTTCRVCQGVESSTKGAAISRDVNPDRTSEDIPELIEEMYFLHLSNRDPVTVEKYAGILGKQVRDLFEEGKKRESFMLFMQILKPLIAGWKEPGAIHDDIIDGLMSEHLRRLIIATRYSAKSTITSIYVAWRIFLDPLIKIMVVSRGSKLAARMLRTVRRVYVEQCPMLHHLRPSEDCLDNAEQYQTPQSLQVATGGITLTSLGMGSNLPGFRSDLTIGDDVEGPQEDTPEKVVQLEEDLNELHMINPRGEKIMLGTYQSEFSVYAKLADLRTTNDDGDEVPVWEEHRALMFEEDKIDGKVVIHSRWPEMFSDKEGMDWRRSVTQRAWRLHVLLIADPSILHERPLKIRDLLVVQGDPKGATFPISVQRTNINAIELPRWSAPKGDDWYEGEPTGPSAPWVGSVMAVDPASGLAGRDAIGVAILGITTAGYGIIRHLEGVRAASKYDAIRRVATIAKEYNVTTLIVEQLADGLFAETLENELVLCGYPLVTEKINTGQQQKGRRIIESLAPVMGAGRLGIYDSVASSEHGGEFVNQLVRISYDGRTGSAKDHDDIVDALAHAVQHSRDSLISDIAQNVADHRVTQLDRWARVPMRHGGLGGGDHEDYPQTSRWSAGRGIDDRSLGERLIDDDEAVIALESRRDRYQETLNQDIRDGRKPDPWMIERIKTLNAQIKELKELQVL